MVAKPDVEPAKRTIDLDDERARVVDGLLRSGRIATEADVVHAGLKALQDDEDLIEDWLRTDVVPVAAAMTADPSRAVSIDDVSEELRRLHASRQSADERGA